MRIILMLILVLTTACQKDILLKENAGDFTITKNNEEWSSEISTSINRSETDIFNLTISNSVDNFNAPWGSLKFRFIPKKIGVVEISGDFNSSSVPNTLYDSDFDPNESTSLGKFELIDSPNNIFEITKISKNEKNVSGSFKLSYKAETTEIFELSGENNDTLNFVGSFEVKIRR